MPDRDTAAAPDAIATDPEHQVPDVPGPRTRSVAPRVSRRVRAARGSAGKPAARSAVGAPAPSAAGKKKDQKVKAPVRPGADVVRVRVGRAEVWMASALATALSAKDVKRLKAVFKKARKRAKTGRG